MLLIIYLYNIISYLFLFTISFGIWIPVDTTNKYQSSYNIDWTTFHPSTNHSTVYLCGSCQEHNIDCCETESVMCELCEKWFHLACQAIQSCEYSRLGHPGVTWAGSACNSEYHTTTSPAMLFDEDVKGMCTTISSSTVFSTDSLDDQHLPMYQSSPRKQRHLPNRKGRPLRIINVSCQFNVNKKGAWINLLNTTKPDIIIATETWLDSTILGSELQSDSFSIYRRDKKSGKCGGGVMNAVNDTITSTEMHKNTDSEIPWVKIQCIGHRDI